MGSLRFLFSLAKRFLFSSASDGFLSLMSWVSIVGIALGVMALTVVTSVMNGFEYRLMQVVTQMHGDILLYSKGQPIHDPEKIEQKIQAILPDTEAIARALVLEVMVAGPQGVSGGVLEGIEADQIGLVTGIPQALQIGRLPVIAGEVTLGSALAEKLGAQEGTEVRLMIPSLEKKGSPQLIKARVVGVFRMGMFEYDSKCLLMSLESVQEFLGKPNTVTSFHIRLNSKIPPFEMHHSVAQLMEHFSYPLRAKDWSQMNKNLFYAIQLEKAVIATILMIIVMVAAFNVVSTLMMMIQDKTQEIAILKVMGLNRWKSFALFCGIGMGMGSVGTVLGVVLGLFLGGVCEHTQWLQLPPDIYSIDFLTMRVCWEEIFWIMGGALGITFLATLYPAWKVATCPLLEGLKYDS